MDKPLSIKVSASILCADFARLEEVIKKCEAAQVDSLHIDVMDGHFVPNITIGPVVIKAVRPLTKLSLEAHLMIEHPEAYIKDFADAGADVIMVHAECFGPLKPQSQGFGKFPKEIEQIDSREARKVISQIKSFGKKAYIVLNPGTPLCIDEILSELDGVLIMSVNPGFANQKFMPIALQKIHELREKFDRDIVVDGGINRITAPEVVKAGANILATASFFFGSSNPKETVKFLKQLSSRT